MGIVGFSIYSKRPGRGGQLPQSSARLKTGEPIPSLFQYCVSGTLLPYRNVILIRELNSVSRHNSPTTLVSPPAKVDFWHLPLDQTLVVTTVVRLRARDRSLPACVITKYPYRQSLRWNAFFFFITEESNLCIVLLVLSSQYRWMDFKTIYTEMFAMYVHKLFAFTWNEKLFAEPATFEHTNRAQNCCAICMATSTVVSL